MGLKQEEHIINVVRHVNELDIESRDLGQPARIRRSSTDKATNSNGRSLLNILNHCHLHTLNGRTVSSLGGHCTFHGHCGSSVIDLYLVSLALARRINYFRVLELSPLSDHCPVAVSLIRNIWINFCREMTAMQN